MIEIEKKFKVTPEQKARLMEGAELLSKETIHDIYYDTVDFRLTSHGQWLRNRDGRWELKLPLHTEERVDRGSTQFRELETEEEIRERLGLAIKGSFIEDLIHAGYIVIVDVITTRQKMKKEEFKIDFDLTDFGYEIVEIELMVDDSSQADEAQKKIVAFAERHGLSTEYVRGKILEYIARKNPTHFHVLELAKVA